MSQVEILSERLSLYGVTMEPLKATFQAFNFEKLEPTWTKQAWDTELTDLENIPSDYLTFLESSDMAQLLKETRAILKNWITLNDLQQESSNCIQKISWQSLLALGLDTQPLLAILAFLIKSGQTFDATDNSRESSLEATCLYFVLLTIPGSNAFQVRMATL